LFVIYNCIFPTSWIGRGFSSWSSYSWCDARWSIDSFIPYLYFDNHFYYHRQNQSPR
jgi:hypothetical protein